MAELILMRHGESVWNRDNIFTGWTDIDLSSKGLSEAERAGRLLAENGLRFDIAYTSVLKRAIKTLWIVLERMNCMWVPVQKSWRLNERFYGDLQHMNKDEAARKFGPAPVFGWRRVYDSKPPAMDSTDRRHPRHDPRYAEIRDELPVTESLKDAWERFKPFWEQFIIPGLKEGRSVLVVAHHNILTGLVKRLEKLPDKATEKMEFPTALPLIYQLDKDLKPEYHGFLGEEEEQSGLIKREGGTCWF